MTHRHQHENFANDSGGDYLLKEFQTPYLIEQHVRLLLLNQLDIDQILWMKGNSYPLWSGSILNECNLVFCLYCQLVACFWVSRFSNEQK